MENYESILDALPETGAYVIREEDHVLLYLNRRVREAFPDARPGGDGRQVGAGLWERCPVLTAGEERERRSVAYSEPYGGVVDVTAVRTLWEGKTPAFIVTISPRMDIASYIYRKIFHVDLLENRCRVLKSESGGWQPDGSPLSPQMERFARSGAIHPEDMERFTAFTRIENLRAVPPKGQGILSLLYRRQGAEGYRWNLMEVIPDRSSQGTAVSAILCVKDVHDALWEGVEREGVGARSRELVLSLGERDFNIYSINLTSGMTDPIRMNGQMRGGAAPLSLPWAPLMRAHITDHLHEDYRAEFERRFSLDGLRQAKRDGLKKSEMLCQWLCGRHCRYISVSAHFSGEAGAEDYAVLAMQDVDERTRQEITRSRRDMQMAAILKSRFRTLTSVQLESGQCELMDLAQDAGGVISEDYGAYVEGELSGAVHPDDREGYLSVLSLEHLREKAAGIEDFEDEICLYRQKGQPVRWMEQRVIYSRQRDQVMVNILGQDVTRQRQQEEARLQIMEERADIISSLSSLFFSTYYIDVDHDSFRAVIQLRRVEDVLGEEVNCTAALQIYANHFVHPDDREEYLRIMNVRYLRETLRWWQPYVALEYRKLPDDPLAGPETCAWVRATAVLARTGPDDMPKTVVYVAQDISTNRRGAGRESV